MLKIILLVSTQSNYIKVDINELDIDNIDNVGNSRINNRIANLLSSTKVKKNSRIDFLTFEAQKSLFINKKFLLRLQFLDILIQNTTFISK